MSAVKGRDEELDRLRRVLVEAIDEEQTRNLRARKFDLEVGKVLKKKKVIELLLRPQTSISQACTQSSLIQRLPTIILLLVFYQGHLLMHDANFLILNECKHRRLVYIILSAPCDFTRLFRH